MEVAGDLHTLTIPEVFEEDAGTYAVQASNPAGEAKSLAKLNVHTVSETTRIRRTVKQTTIIRKEEIAHEPPEFKKLFQDVRVKPGEPATFECVVTGNPRPKVRYDA